MAVSNKQIANVFNKAKSHLWDGVRNYWNKEEFICLAIDLVPASEASRQAAKDIIEERLDGEFTLEMWLVNNGYLPWRHSDRPEDCQVKLQAHRLAWVKLLEEEFRNK